MKNQTHLNPSRLIRKRRSATAENARSAATVVAKLPEPSDCPAGRRFAAALWLGCVILRSVLLSSQHPIPADSQGRRSSLQDQLSADRPLWKTGDDRAQNCVCAGENLLWRRRVVHAGSGLQAGGEDSGGGGLSRVHF